MLLFYLAIFVGDTPIPLPNVKASLLAPVSDLSVCTDKLIVFFRLLNFAIIIKMIKKLKKSMRMRMMIQIKICMNRKGINFSFFFSE